MTDAYTIQKLYKDIWEGSLIPTYLTLMTQIPGSEEYLISETIIWKDRRILNKMYEMFPDEIWQIPGAKKLELDCICHTREEHLAGMREVGINTTVYENIKDNK